MKAFILILAVVAAGLVTIRLMPLRAERYHVDPSTISPPNRPNFDLRRGDEARVFGGTLAQTAERLQRAIDAEGGRLIGGDLAEGHASYLFRTRLMGYPDILSIRLEENSDGTRIDLFARALIGYRDFGVNRARVDRLLRGLHP